MAGGEPVRQPSTRTDVKPFLIPFDALYASNSTSSDLNKSTVIITVK